MKAIIYARFSPRPNAAECLSLQTQLERARASCRMRNWEIYNEHFDKGVSGAKADNRPGLQGALTEVCRLKDAGVLVVYSLSRLARSTKDAIAIADRLDKAGAHLVSLTEQIDTTTAMGRAFFRILAVLAELERELVVERTSDAMHRHQAAGRRMSYHTPYGWKVDPENGKLLAEDQGEQEVIKRVLDLAALGMSARSICRTLDAEGVPCRAARWYHAAIDRIIARDKRLRAMTGASEAQPIAPAV